MGYGEERECIKPRAGDADLWIKIWDELHLLTSKKIVEVEHVKAHRTKKDKNEVTQFEKFVAECKEKADKLAKADALLDEGFVTHTRAKTVKQEREEVYAALLCHCLEEWKDCEELKPKPKEIWIFVNKKSEETKHRTEWCAYASKYRCMRCGRGSEYMKM